MEFANTTGGSASLILMIFLAAAVATDVHSRRIPNSLVTIMLLSGLSLHAAYLGWSGILTALTGVVVGFAILIPFYAFRALGAGDVKLLAASGAFLGGWGVAIAGAATLIVGGLLGIAIIFWQRIGSILTARFLSIPAAVAASDRTVTIPYSIAVAAGATVTIYRYDALMSLLFG